MIRSVVLARALGTGLLLVLAALGPVRCVAMGAESQRIELPGGQQVETRRFAGTGRATLLWLPSERGFGNAADDHAARLAELGHTVWIADLHASYRVEPGRDSIRRFPLQQVTELLEIIAAGADSRLFLMSSGRGAQLALIAAREWQLRHPGEPALAGLFLSHAHLYAARAAPGEDAEYLPIVHATNLPVYLLAAEYSTKASRLEELATALQSGGSKVYRQRLASVRGGFANRSVERSTDPDRAARLGFPATVSRALSLLGSHAPPARAHPTRLDTRRLGQPASRVAGLRPIDRELATPALRLNDIAGAAFDLDEHRGEVLLVNFWASWCRPCVTEIPSLHRLADQLADEDFGIVTVNVGESRQQVERFMQQVPVELPVLMDYDSSVSRDWKLYVYPSSYLLDRHGKIRYAYLGALEWDSMENVEIIRDLLSRP